jgi:hypothetical protein
MRRRFWLGLGGVAVPRVLTAARSEQEPEIERPVASLGTPAGQAARFLARAAWALGKGVGLARALASVSRTGSFLLPGEGGAAAIVADRVEACRTKVDRLLASCN